MFNKNTIFCLKNLFFDRVNTRVYTRRRRHCPLCGMHNGHYVYCPYTKRLYGQTKNGQNKNHVEIYDAKVSSKIVEKRYHKMIKIVRSDNDKIMRAKKIGFVKKTLEGDLKTVHNQTQKELGTIPNRNEWCSPEMERIKLKKYCFLTLSKFF